MSEDDKPYQLIAVGDARSASPSGWRHVGSYPDEDSALRARVEDVLDQLARNDGWLITVEHLLVGPNPDGQLSTSSHITQLGADPFSERIPDPHNEPATRRWLLAAHQLCD